MQVECGRDWGPREIAGKVWVGGVGASVSLSTSMTMSGVGVGVTGTVYVRGRA
jgi:hypothetical protein